VTKTILILAITAAFVAGMLVSAPQVFAPSANSQGESLVSSAIDRLTEVMQNTATQGPQGIQGEKGDKGDKGDQGDPGSAGTLPYIYFVSADSALIPVGSIGSVSPQCNSGDRAISGGYIASTEFTHAISAGTDGGSIFVDNPTLWQITARNDGLFPRVLTGVVYCIDETP
jgi:hypothetical protein